MRDGEIQASRVWKRFRADRQRQLLRDQLDRVGRRITSVVRPGEVFIPFHWGGAGCANRLTNPALDPTSRMPEFKVCAARIDREPEDRLSADYADFADEEVCR